MQERDQARLEKRGVAMFALFGGFGHAAVAASTGVASDGAAFAQAGFLCGILATCLIAAFKAGRDGHHVAAVGLLYFLIDYVLTRLAALFAIGF